jgi:hypothetical protein
VWWTNPLELGRWWESREKIGFGVKKYSGDDYVKVKVKVSPVLKGLTVRFLIPEGFEVGEVKVDGKDAKFLSEQWNDLRFIYVVLPEGPTSDVFLRADRKGILE